MQNKPTDKKSKLDEAVEDFMEVIMEPRKNIESVAWLVSSLSSATACVVVNLFFG